MKASILVASFESVRERRTPRSLSAVCFPFLSFLAAPSCLLGRLLLRRSAFSWFSLDSKNSDLLPCKVGRLLPFPPCGLLLRWSGFSQFSTDSTDADRTLIRIIRMVRSRHANRTGQVGTRAGVARPGSLLDSWTASSGWVSSPSGWIRLELFSTPST